MAENPNDEIINIIRSAIIFEPSAGIGDVERDTITKSFCDSLRIVLEWNSQNYPHASAKALELYPRLLRVGARALRRKKFSIKLTKDKKGMTSATDGEVVPDSKIIWITLNSSVSDKIQVFIHEFTHFNLLNIYDNECYPFMRRRNNAEESDEQRKKMVLYNKMVAPFNGDWYALLSHIPEEHAVSKTRDLTGPNWGVGGTLMSFKACDKTGQPGAELLAENTLLLETIPHMMEMIFILTDIDVNCEKVFATNDQYNEAIVFFVDFLLGELKMREPNVW